MCASFSEIVMDGAFMELHYRQKDVDKLVCNAVQDFMSLLAQSGWKRKIFEVAKEAINDNLKYKDKYIYVYETMLDYGIENYSVDKMDVTLISSIINFGHKFKPEISVVTDETKRAINVLREEKNNFASHSNQNEPLEEKYLQCIITLYHLKQFIRIVDKKEVYISENKRIAYRKKYIPKIDELISQLDQDRYELIYEKKSIEENVQKVLSSNDRSKAYSEMIEMYRRQERISKSISEIEWERSRRLKGKFNIAASYVGISEAHDSAFLALLYDYPTETIIQHIKHIKPFTLDIARCVLANMSLFSIRHDEFLPVVQAVREEGYEIKELDNHRFSVKPIWSLFDFNQK